MNDLRDPGGSNPLPPVYSRLTDCAGLFFFYLFIFFEI